MPRMGIISQYLKRSPGAQVYVLPSVTCKKKFSLLRHNDKIRIDVFFLHSRTHWAEKYHEGHKVSPGD